MNAKKINTEMFEKDSISIFEKILQGYRRASQSSVWESNMDNLIDKLIRLPTDPFAVRLMELFDYNYLVLSEDICTIIEKSLEIRDQLKHTQRCVNIKEHYYSLPFLKSNTHLKRLEVLNHENELCYLLVGKIQIKFQTLINWLIPGYEHTRFQDVFHFSQETKLFKELEIYYYSSLVDLSTTDPQKYYDFYCDYHGKIQFIKYFSTKENASISPDLNVKINHNDLEEVRSLTSSQQVIWAYFLFRLMGLKLRVNVEVAIITRFLLIVNRTCIDEYKNSYFYKLVSKAPYVKEDKKLLSDLEVVRIYFQNRNLPTCDIEKEIHNLVSP